MNGRDWCPQRDYQPFNPTSGAHHRTVCWGNQGGRMTYQLALLTRREHTAQKVTMQCHELLTSLQCHELFSWCLSYDGVGPARDPSCLLFLP